MKNVPDLVHDIRIVQSNRSSVASNHINPATMTRTSCYKLHYQLPDHEALPDWSMISVTSSSPPAPTQMMWATNCGLNAVNLFNQLENESSNRTTCTLPTSPWRRVYSEQQHAQQHLAAGGEIRHTMAQIGSGA